MAQEKNRDGILSLQAPNVLPGVSSATLSYASPMITPSECVANEGTDTSQPALTAGANVIGPDYFSTLGIPLARGRIFGPGDNSAAPPVVLVNEALAGGTGREDTR